jgi:hypothetical protein
MAAGKVGDQPVACKMTGLPRGRGSPVGRYDPCLLADAGLRRRWRSLTGREW